MDCHIEWEIAFGYRRWQGWRIRQLLWWLWPVRWCFVRSGSQTEITDYYLSANDAAIAMVKYVIECERDHNESGVE